MIVLKDGTILKCNACTGMFENTVYAYGDFYAPIGAISDDAMHHWTTQKVRVESCWIPEEMILHWSFNDPGHQTVNHSTRSRPPEEK